MQVYFYLLLVLRVAKGCTLKDFGQQEEITAYTGGSVLLPCYCTDLQTKPERFTWERYSTDRDTWENILSKSDQYRNRVQLVKGHSPGNLSLLISHLTEEDGGVYTCNVIKKGHFFIKLTLKGCTLKDNQQTKYITAYTGGSVLLPCYCTDPHTKPETFMWRKYITNRDTWDEISSESGQYRNRFQLVNGHSTGNLSLLISHLDGEKGGTYQCDSGSNQYIYIILTVKEAPASKPTPTLDRNTHLNTSAEPSTTTPSHKEPPQSLPFVPFALVTVIFLHIIVAVVYHTKRNKDTATVHYSSVDDDGAVKLQHRIKPTDINRPATDFHHGLTDKLGAAAGRGQALSAAGKAGLTEEAD